MAQNIIPTRKVPEKATSYADFLLCYSSSRFVGEESLMRSVLTKVGSIGLFFSVYCLVRYLLFRKRLVIIGWDTFLKLVEECDGKCIIASNHPTLWEPIFIKVLLWNWYKKDFNRHPKNVTAVDELRLYPQYIQVLFKFAGLIPINRDVRSSGKGMYLGMAHALKKNCPIIVCPEARCTATPANPERVFESNETYPVCPEKRAPHTKQPYMLMPQDKVLVFACREQVPIITAKVTLGAPLWLMSESHRHELKKIWECGMTIEFSDSLLIPKENTTATEFAHAILNPTHKNTEHRE